MPRGAVPAGRRGAVRRTRAASAPRAIVYSVGWTQHTVGVQYIRAAAIIQLLLGNIGRPGGGILALRGHANIQGSTDIPTLYNILPGLHPDAARRTQHGDLDDVRRRQRGPDDGRWGDMRRLRGQPAEGVVGRRGDRGERLLLRLACRGSTATTRTTRRCCEMLDGDGEGVLRASGENPAVGSANAQAPAAGDGQARLAGRARPREIETATFWQDAPEIETGELRTEDIATEVFFLPAAAHTEKDGSFTNTQRLLQWHHKAVEPPGDCRSELWFIYHLGRRIREKLAGSTERPGPADARPDLGLPDGRSARGAERRGGAPGDQRPHARRRQVRLRLRRAAGRRLAPRAAAGSTAGIYADGVNQPARRKPRRRAELGRAPNGAGRGPTNRRILYNRASADPDGKPWSERKRYVWWDAEQGKWTGHDVARLQARQAAGLRADRGRHGPRRAARRRAVHHAARRPGLAVRARPAWWTARCRPTTSRTSRRSRNPLYGQQANPARQSYDRTENPYNPDRRRAGRRRVPVRAHHLPADRAPHRRRDVAHGPLPRPSSSPSCSARSARSWPPSAGWSTAAGRRSSPPARRSRRA